MSTITYIVKIASGKFTIDDAVAPKLTFRDGDTYIFDQSDGTNAGHILQFSATSNNSGSSEYTTGVTKTGTAGQAGAKTTIVTSSSTTDTLYYYSSGGGEHGREFSNTGFNTSANYNVLKPIVGSSSTAEKWGAMVNHAIDQIDLQAKDNRDYTDQHAYQGEPHIIPDTLYPAWSGLIDNHTGYTFTDSSASARAITSTGDVHHTGSISKIGNTSISFNKDNGTDDVLQIPDHADFDFAGGDFTIEFWFNTHGGARQFLFGFESDFHLSLDYNNASATALDRINLWASSNGTGWDISHADGSGNGYGTVTVSPNTWYHVAIVRNGTSWKTFINGQQNTSITSSSALTAYNSEDIRFGRHGSNDNYPFKGYMDDIRITKGLAVYTGAFTPQTTALTTTWSAGTNIVANSTASNVKLLIHSDATGAHSGAYGTAQADGRMYYYTDIKGSKPIKDPKIGAHFGSQRHKFKSLQLLEQETATHGEDVYSIDGREWMRSITGLMDNGANGLGLYWEDSTVAGVIEIVGYFSDANLIAQTRDGTSRSFTWAIDGGSPTTNNSLECAVENPLRNRYVDASSLVNLGLSQTLGIHTLKLSTPAVSGDTPDLNGIELIAQDTSSTANKSKIQIPAQNVVSYGKKFSIPATAQHYDPFNGFTNGSSVTAYVDTATSLGVEAWKNSSTYYRPYNGGRVVKWIASDGTIKTSVNMMPPNAQNIAGSAISAKANASVANDTYLPTFSGAIDHSQAEVAKTFHWREFGNGAANGGTGGTYADASMLSGTADDIAYVMDDGLTSISGKGVHTQNITTNGGLRIGGNSQSIYWTFIGTGISQIRQRDNTTNEEPVTWAQNLPYGTHICELQRDSNASQVVKIDGVTLETDSTTEGAGGLYLIFGGPTIHQPKKPPIPQDAVIISDYMLMADFVPQTSAGIDKISKGTRSVSTSRDFFIDDTGSNTVALNLSAIHLHGYKIGSSATADSDTTITFRLPAFATNYVSRGYQSDTRHKLFIDTTDKDSSATKDNTAVDGSYAYLTTSETLGVQKWGDNVVSGQYAVFEGFDIVTPIHTSSHYQPFETPYLMELTGGDRNMEQNNLIVTPDGKSWDEVTRDTSYIGPSAGFNLSTELGNGSDHLNVVIYTLNRGGVDGVSAIDEKKSAYYNKDFAIAYDRMICLKDGTYIVHFGSHSTGHVKLYINGQQRQSCHQNSVGLGTAIVKIKRGDYLQRLGGYTDNTDDEWDNWACHKIGD